MGACGSSPEHGEKLAAQRLFAGITENKPNLVAALKFYGDDSSSSNASTSNAQTAPGAANAAAPRGLPHIREIHAPWGIAGQLDMGILSDLRTHFPFLERLELGGHRLAPATHDITQMLLHLPPTLRTIWLNRNPDESGATGEQRAGFSGTIRFSALPAAIEKLAFSMNELEGEAVLDELRAIKWLICYGNKRLIFIGDVRRFNSDSIAEYCLDGLAKIQVRLGGRDGRRVDGRAFVEACRRFRAGAMSDAEADAFMSPSITEEQDVERLVAENAASAASSSSPLAAEKTSMAATDWLEALAQQHGVAALDAATMKALVVDNGIDSADVLVQLTPAQIDGIAGISLGARIKVKSLIDAVNKKKQQSLDANSHSLSRTPTTGSVTSSTSHSTFGALSEDDFASVDRFEAKIPPRYVIAQADIEIGASLGGGGMGAILQGRLRSTQETVALKFCRERDDKSLRRWHREIFVTLKTRHRAVVTGIGVVFAQSALYGKEAVLVLEKGDCSLEDFVEQHQQQGTYVDPLRYVAMFRQAAEALGYMHARGLVHCDVKPGNCIICGSNLKLIDLGLVIMSKKEVEDRFGVGGGGAAGHASHTVATSVGMTLTYAPPECAEAGFKREILDARLIDSALDEANLLPPFRLLDEAQLRAATEEERRRYEAARRLVAVMRMCVATSYKDRPRDGVELLRLLLGPGEPLPDGLLPARSKRGKQAGDHGTVGDANNENGNGDGDGDDDEQRDGFEQALQLVRSSSASVTPQQGASTVSRDGAPAASEFVGGASVTGWN